MFRRDYVLGLLFGVYATVSLPSIALAQATVLVAPTPVINSLDAAEPGLSQSLAPMHGAAFTLTVSGANFASDAVVRADFTPLATTFLSGSKLTAIVPASMLTTTRAIRMVVVSGSRTSNAVNLSVVHRGDVNADLRLDITDAVLIARNSSRLTKPPIPDSVGDLNLSGKIDIGDALAAALLIGGLKDNFDVPSITSVSPNPAVRSALLTIEGTGFSPVTASNQILFSTSDGSAVRVTPTTATRQLLTVTVPANATGGPIQVFRLDAGLGGQQFPLFVAGTSEPLLLNPVKPSVLPKPGSSMILTGTGFDPTVSKNQVTFRSPSGFVNGVVTAATRTSVTVNVPEGSVCGVSVTTGSTTSNWRAALAGTDCGLKVASVLGTAKPGDIVMIEGVGFDAAMPSLNSLTFNYTSNSVGASVLMAGRTQLHIRIPDSAVDGKVRLSVGGQIVNLSYTQSTGKFVVVPTEQLTVSPAGGGRISSNPAGINCHRNPPMSGPAVGAPDFPDPTNVCAAEFPWQSQLILTASADSGFKFTGWSGACTGQSRTCTVTMDTSKNVAAGFIAIQKVTVSRQMTNGFGNGRITSNPAGIDCPNVCEADFPAGSGVSLTVTADPGSKFSYWSSACYNVQGEGGIGSALVLYQPTCNLTMNGDKTVVATFEQLTYSLHVDRLYSGGGSLTVQSDPPGIACPSRCDARFPAGTVVTLTATPSSSTFFAGWAGSCTGNGTCTILMDGDKREKAYYGLINPPPPPSCTTAAVTFYVSPSLYGVMTAISIQSLGTWQVVPPQNTWTVSGIPRGLYTATVWTSAGVFSQTINVGCASNLVVFR